MKINSKPTLKTYPLKSDPDGQASVTIRQATFREDMLRNDAFSVRRTHWTGKNSDIPIVEESRNYARQMLKEIYVTLADATGFLDERNKELFAFREGRLDISEREFEDIIGQPGFTRELVQEIHNCVLRTNPTWGTPSDEEPKVNDEGEVEEKNEGESNATSG